MIYNQNYPHFPQFTFLPQAGSVESVNQIAVADARKKKKKKRKKKSRKGKKKY